LPPAQETAGSEWCDVGGIRQVFIGDVDTNTVCDFASDALGKAQEHVCEALASIAGNER